MNWDSALPVAIPVLVAIVSAIGSGSVVKVWIERDLTRATTEKMLAEGEVAQSQEHREWVRVAHEETAAVRVEAKERIDEIRTETKLRTEIAETRMAAAEKKAEAADRQVWQLERKVDELVNELREMKLLLAGCPGGVPCPLAGLRDFGPFPLPPHSP